MYTEYAVGELYTLTSLSQNVIFVTVTLLCFIGCGNSKKSQPKDNPNIIATGTYNGQTISLEYVETNILYPIDMRYISFENGGAIFFDRGTVGENNESYVSGFNAIDKNGSRIFDTTFKDIISDFNKDGLTIAYPHDNEEQFYVINTKGEIVSTHYVNDFSPSEYPIEISGFATREPAAFEDMTEISATTPIYNDLFAFVKNGKLGIADKDGNIIISPTVNIDFISNAESLSMNEDMIYIKPANDTDNSPLVMIRIHRK